MKHFLVNQFIPNDCNVIHINCRNDIIGSQTRQPVVTNNDIESEDEFELLSGISTLLMSRGMPGIEINVYRDEQIFDIKF